MKFSSTKVRRRDQLVISQVRKINARDKSMTLKNINGIETKIGNGRYLKATRRQTMLRRHLTCQYILYGNNRNIITTLLEQMIVLRKQSVSVHKQLMNIV